MSVRCSSLSARPQGFPADSPSIRLQGVLQVDGYAGYRALAEKGDVSLAFCWAHLRRRFHERFVFEASPIAAEALQRIAALYRIETDIRGRGPDERRAVRQERSGPLVVALHGRLRDGLTLIGWKSKLAEVIRYGIGLTRFREGGLIEIDSNTVERSIRPITLNRENALFAGSDGGRENWAVIASLVETCKLSGVYPQAYIADVLTRIVKLHLARDIGDLLPWAYAEARSKTRPKNIAYEPSTHYFSLKHLS